MVGSAAAFIARFRRDRARARNSPAEDQLADGATADAIDRAIGMERWAHAERLARAASEIEPKSPRLVERLARVRLARATPEAALHLIDGSGLRAPLPASLRLLRAACLVHLGERGRAASDLRRWLHEKAAPLDAGVILALLDWHAGDEHAATLTLLRNIRWLEHPQSLELLLLIAVSGARHEQAEVWARRLAAANAGGLGAPFASMMSMSVDVAAPPRVTSPSREQVDALARDLRAAEVVIPTLVEAQRRRPQPDAAALLAGAIEAALDDLRDPGTGIEALATLAIVRARTEEAGRWIDEGLRRNPRSRSLARLRRELGLSDRETDDVLATIGPVGATRPSNEEKAA